MTIDVIDGCNTYAMWRYPKPDTKRVEGHCLSRLWLMRPASWTMLYCTNDATRGEGPRASASRCVGLWREQASASAADGGMRLSHNLRAPFLGCNADRTHGRWHLGTRPCEGCLTRGAHS